MTVLDTTGTTSFLISPLIPISASLVPSEFSTGASVLSLFSLFSLFFPSHFFSPL
ncbi:MAG: hypothetical protein ACK5YA_01230 [bacterium]